jgi:nicotinamidase-related amidase
MVRHPLTLLTNAVRPLAIQPEHAVLLLQDVHAPFADPDHGYLARKARAKVLLREFDEYFDTLRIVSPNFPKLIEAARKQRIKVMFSILGHAAGAEPSAFQRATGWEWDLSSPDGAFPPGWTPDPERGDAVFSKPGWSALGNAAFAERLDELRVEHVIVAGTMLEFGIVHTAYDLQGRGTGVLVVSDAVVALTYTGGRQASGSMAHGLIKLRSTAETLDLLARLDEEGAVLV